MSFISNDTRALFTGISESGFYSFAREIVINKEPIKTFADLNSSTMVGYPNTANQALISTTPVSGVYSGVIHYGRDFGLTVNDFIKAKVINNGKTQVKFLSDGHQYLQNGRTESLFFDGMYWNVTSACKVKNYLGLKYYIYEVTQTS